MRKKIKMEQGNQHVAYVPKNVRYLCALVSTLIVARSLFELWIMLEGWFHGDAFQKVFQGYCEYYPGISEYIVNGWWIFIITFLLDCLDFLPYYFALILTAVVFNRFRNGIYLDVLNIKTLKSIGILIIFCAIFPEIKDTLQILTFTSSGSIILVMNYGINEEIVSRLTIGLAMYTFSKILKLKR